MKSSFELNGGKYRKVGDYRIPNLALPPEETKIKLGKWGMLHKDYMIQHQKAQFTIMLSNGTLWTYLAEIDKQASSMFSRLVEQMKINEHITERLKEEKPLEYISDIVKINTD